MLLHSSQSSVSPDTCVLLFPQVYAQQAQLLCGSLKLDVAGLVNDGVLTWQDTLHPAQPVPADEDEDVSS